MSAERMTTSEAWGVDPAVEGTVKRRAAWLSVASNSLLIVVKLAVGLITGSVAMIAEAAHSASDLVAAIVAAVAVRVSGAPPDPSHRYGHGKAEDIAGVIEGALIVVAALVIAFEAALRLRSGDHVAFAGVGAAVMAASALVNYLVSRRLLAVAERTQSAALRADAMHLLTDVATAAGVAVGLVVVALTDLRWLDPALAVVISLIVLRAGWVLVRDSIGVLMDATLPDDELDAVRAELAGVPEIHSHHRLRGRRAGRRRYIDVHIQVDDALTVADAHLITDRVELAVARLMPGAEILIHVEPATHHEDDEPVLSALDQRPEP